MCGGGSDCRIYRSVIGRKERRREGGARRHGLGRIGRRPNCRESDWLRSKNGFDRQLKNGELAMQLAGNRDLLLLLIILRLEEATASPLT